MLLKEILGNMSCTHSLTLKRKARALEATDEMGIDILPSDDNLWYAPPHFQMQTQRLLKTGNFQGDPMVTLHVGDKAQFQAHKGCLCYVSPVFDAAFNEAFQERGVSMVLPEDDPALLERLVR